MKAFVLSAGLGTRLMEETHHKPKALVEVGGKPLLQIAIEKLKEEGIKEIVVNVHHFPEQITDFLNRNYFGVNIKISDESNKLLDTGGALKKAAPLLKSLSEPVLIYNVDILCNIQLHDLLEAHLTSGALATLAVRKRETQRYFRFNKGKRLIGWINKKTGEVKTSVNIQLEVPIERAFSGISIVDPQIFGLLPEVDRFSLTDFFLLLSGEYMINGYFDESDFWLDAGKPESLKKARELFK